MTAPQTASAHVEGRAITPRGADRPRDDDERREEESERQLLEREGGPVRERSGRVSKMPFSQSFG